MDQNDDSDVQLGAGEKMADDGKVPFDFHFVHLSNDEGDELVKIEDNRGIPLNFRFWKY